MDVQVEFHFCLFMKQACFYIYHAYRIIGERDERANKRRFKIVDPLLLQK